jgi:hypothetical protein
MVKHFGLWYGFLTNGLSIYFSAQGYYIFKPLDLHSKYYCRNLNIGFVTKCEMQAPMRPKMCLGVKHIFTNGGECKG